MLGDLPRKFELEGKRGAGACAIPMGSWITKIKLSYFLQLCMHCVRTELQKSGRPTARCHKTHEDEHKKSKLNKTIVSHDVGSGLNGESWRFKN